MIRIVPALIALAVLLGPLPASAGSMHQSPAMRHNEKQLCGDGKPMRHVRSGRTVLTSCN